MDVNLFDDLSKKLKATDVSWTQVCEVSGVNQATVHQWRTGKNQPTRSTYNRLIFGLGQILVERMKKMKRVGLA